MENIQQFAAQLIDIPSVTGNEQSLSHFLKEFLAKKGLSVNLMPVAAERYNVYATFSAHPDIVLTTHMDTVAPFISSRIEKDILYGRGACDAKGIIAAMVYAVLGLEKQLQRQVGLLFVVGEEVDSIGAKKAAQSDVKPHYFINGEPTENKLVHAQKGTYLFEILARGKAAHSGYPEYGSSAIDTLLQYLQRIKNYNWPQNDVLGRTLVNIGKISGGEAINTLASSAKAECTIRVVSSARDVNEILHGLLIDGVTINTYSASDPVRLYCPAEIEDTINVNYGSDVFYLQAAARVLMMGPGSILNAHTENEHILVSELKQAVIRYQELIKILLKKND